MAGDDCVKIQHGILLLLCDVTKHVSTHHVRQ